MAHKHMLFRSEARERILSGATALADAVRVTLGPKSKCVLIEKKWGKPLACNDGVTIAKEMSLENPEENLGAQMIREAAERTGDAVGDGTEVRLVNGMYKVPSAFAEPALAQIADWVAREQSKTKDAPDAAAKTLKSAGLKVTVIMNDEEPKHLLCSEAEDFGADCIFVGSRGAGLVERFHIGSVSSAVAVRAHCSVEVVRT